MSFQRSTSSLMEERTRVNGHFNDTESSLASVSTRPSHALHKAHKFAHLFSYLGASNPLPAPIEADDVVWVMDNVAFRGRGGQWEAEFVAAAFDQQASPAVVDIVGDIASKVGLSKGAQEEQTIEERIAPFIMEVLPGRQVKLNFGGSTPIKLGPGGRNGISSDIRKVPNAKAGSLAQSTADVPMGVVGSLKMKTFYAEPEGWAVISDVDDTIKVTQTSDPVGILRTTFASEPIPVPGMPELYAQLHRLLTPSAPFFYLSASPYNLYPFLREFRETFYPHGQLILRDSSWMTLSGLLSSLTLGTERYKTDRMKKIHRWLPRGKLICIGDSTQSDPEAYGDIFRSFPGWIKLILIRKVSDVAAVGIEEKNEDKRFEKAFEGVPRGNWHLFEDPGECWDIIQRTVAKG